jgi:integrase
LQRTATFDGAIQRPLSSCQQSVSDPDHRQLKEWRLRSGRRDPAEPIIGPMSEGALKLCGVRHLRPAVEAVTRGRITDATVYTLRHTHASALHYCSYTTPEAARRMGHGPGLHIDTYAHVIDGLSGERSVDRDALIAVARAETIRAKALRTESIRRHGSR